MSIRQTTIQRLVNEASKIFEEEEIDFSSLNQMLSRGLLIPFAQWIKGKPYTRICLHENEEFELILICWQPFSKTAVHNHNNQNCWVFSFDSEFEEVVYCDKGKHVMDINSVAKGSIAFMEGNSKCHSLQNLSDQQVMTIHLYNKPIKTCQVVRGSVNEESCLNKSILNYDVNLSI